MPKILLKLQIKKNRGLSNRSEGYPLPIVLPWWLKGAFICWHESQLSKRIVLSAVVSSLNCSFPFRFPPFNITEKHFGLDKGQKERFSFPLVFGSFS